MYLNEVWLGAKLEVKSNDTCLTWLRSVWEAVIFFNKPESQKDQPWEEKQLIKEWTNKLKVFVSWLNLPGIYFMWMGKKL